MSDGISEMERRETIERDVMRQKQKEEIVDVFDDLKWIFAEKILDRLYGEEE